MAPGFVKKNLTFWGTVGGVMTALKLKQHYDEYRQVPGEEGSEGPVALHSPLLENAELPEHMILDTEIPMARPKRKSCRDCCVCCGMRCGLFWKAFGIVCLLFFGWQAIKLVIWLLTPSPTGLEGIPKFSSSLGCANAPYFYNGSETIYTIPVGPDGGHSVDLRGGAAVGTFSIIDAHPRVEEVAFEITIRTDDESLLNSIGMSVPTADDIARGAESRLTLSTPDARTIGSSCVRYDILMLVPSNVKKFTLLTSSTGAAQVQFMKEAQLTLDKMSILMYGDSPNNMLLPATTVHAKDLHLEMTGGWMVGEVALIENTGIYTQRGAAVANVKVHPISITTEDEDAVPPTANFETVTGSGRSDFFYISDKSVPHRPIKSNHISARNGDLYLTYKEAEFNGKVNVQAKSYTATGVHDMFNNDGSSLPWAGDADGPDMVKAQSTSGWIGVYF